MGGKEIFEQVRILPTVSQIPTLVPGGSASHGLCTLDMSPLADEMFYLKVFGYFNIEIPSVQAQDSSTF